MQNIANCQKIKLPQGAIYLGDSTEDRSVGYLELKPMSSLTIHNRPVPEVLTQIDGKGCVIEFGSNGDTETIIMNEGDSHTIAPAGKWHIHVNPFQEPSLTYWDFLGDIRDIIEEIRLLNREK